MTTTIVIEGLDKVQKMIDPARMNRAFDRALDLSGVVLADETKKMPPVSAKSTGYGAKGLPTDTARMRNTIHSRRLSQLAVGLIAPVKYASYVHDGTGRVPARPFFRWLIDHFRGGEKVVEVFNREISKALNVK